MSMLSNFQIDEAKGLIAKDELEKAIEVLLVLSKESEYYDEIIGVSGHFHRLKNNEIRGFGFEYNELAKVRFSLIELANQINQKINFSYTENINNDSAMLSSKSSKNLIESSYYRLVDLMDKLDPFLTRGEKGNKSVVSKLKKFNSPNVVDSLEFASNILKIKINEITESKNKNIDYISGEWKSKWNREIDLIFGVKMGNNSSDWFNGKGHIFFEDDWIIMQFKDYRYEYLIRAKQFGERLIGRYMNCQNENDNTPWFGEIKDNNSIEGVWVLGQWNFWR
jgi:hypothetical protein